VSSLDHFSRILLFDVEVEANEREGQPNRFCVFVRILRDKRINDMLMDE